MDNVSYSYEEVLALDKVNLQLYKNDVMYLIGPNGAGKSTLIKILTSILKPCSGNLKINTHNIGYMPQTLNSKSNFPITVEEVIYTGFSKQHIIMKKSDKELIHYWLEKMGISDTKGKLIHTLSGGQQQRVFLIRTLISNPELLIFDEPTSALDPSFRKHFYELIQELHRSGSTIIIITHDVNDALQSGKIAYLDQNIKFLGGYNEYKNWRNKHND